MRAPETSSNMSRIPSRKSKAYMIMLCTPRSRPVVPSQTRWLAMRISSAKSSRTVTARGGTSNPKSFSTAKT